MTSNKPIVIMGDINIDNLTDNGKSITFNEALLSYGIKRFKLPPTRITEHSNSSIDCICTNMEATNINLSVLTTGLSDHTAQTCSVNVETIKTTMAAERKRQINDDSVAHLKYLLQAQDWASVVKQNNTNSAFDSFNCILQLSLNTACPYVTKKPKSKQKMWDTHSNQLKKAFLEALNKQIMTGKQEDKQEATRRKKLYDLYLKSLRKKENAKYIGKAENKTKALWGIINRERRPNYSNKTYPTLLINGETVSCPYKIANYLNELFVTTAEKTLAQNGFMNTKPLQSDTNVALNFALSETNYKEISSVIDSLKAKTTAGPDGLSSKLIKSCKEELIPPLVHLVNTSFEQGIFPTSLKTSKVYPKHKNGSTADATNYRPITLTSTFSKIIEKIVLKRLLHHLQNNNLLSPHQHGFTKGKSTVTALAQFIETIIDQLEQGNMVNGIFLDFSKAFDCLGFELIIQKLESLGVRGKEADWFSSYLNNRKQVVELTVRDSNKLFKISSRPLPTTRGVPQGSVLGPMLFILLTNDFSRSLVNLCDIIMYADDSTLVLANKQNNTLNHQSISALNKAKEYCQNNDLILNENKTRQIIFSMKREDPVGATGLVKTEVAKYLGIIVDQKLSWNHQVDMVCSKLSSSIYVIRRIRQISTNESARVAYHALFESTLRYGLIIWGGTSATNMERILRVQKRAIRALTGLSQMESCREAFKELKILTAISLYIYQTILYAIDSDNTKRADQHHYNTKNRQNFVLPNHHLALYERKPSYSGAKLFNLLPEDLRRLSPCTFKTALKNWLLQYSFYSLTEFHNWKKETEGQHL